MTRRFPVFPSFFGSVAVHGALLALALLLFRANREIVSFNPHALLPIEVARSREGSARADRSRSHGAGNAHGPHAKLDLRPSFAKNGFIPAPQTGDSENSRSQEISNPWSQELLFTESKVSEVFDLLASRIDRHLDYPWMLAENGIQGMATLELFFDHQGRIDESRSRFFGDNRTVRGLLVKAAREGLIDWFSSDARRINREQFRDQRFRADFLISGGIGDSSQLSREGLGSYRLLRRRYVRQAVNCVTTALINPSPMIDLACLGAKLVGSLKGKMDSTYIARFNALKDTLEEYDQRELGGINAQIERSS